MGRGLRKGQEGFKVGRQMNIADKENLHPGEHGVRVTDLNDMELEDSHGVVDGDKRVGCVGSNVVGILERRISGAKAHKTIKNWGFTHSVRVEADGFSGGIWIVWRRDDIQINVLAKDVQFIQFLERFENDEVRISPRVGSDHHPLLVNLSANKQEFRRRNFPYEAMWHMHESFEEVMRKGWRGNEEANVKLVTLQQKLTIWNKEVFGHVEGKKRRILNRLNGSTEIAVGGGSRVTVAARNQ
ncbi:hypothetical protein K1719_039040 [Acacia pycnantha]|nr:hypothetical protein K1719_039040 [Acacia pycnantha]